MKKIPVIKYTRVVGYVRPIHLWNKGKQAEWQCRRIIAFANTFGRSADRDSRTV